MQSSFLALTPGPNFAAEFHISILIFAVFKHMLNANGTRTVQYFLIYFICISNEINNTSLMLQGHIHR